MDFDVSKEEWKMELRNKSPIYAAFDENNNMCEIRKKFEDNDTDNDSGLQSIDGDSAQERHLSNILVDRDIKLNRQDSGLSSESYEISSPYLKSSKVQQVHIGKLATKNKSLSRNSETKQVEVNGIPADLECQYRNRYNQNKTNSHDIVKLKKGRYLQAEDKNANIKGKVKDEKYQVKRNKDASSRKGSQVESVYDDYDRKEKQRERNHRSNSTSSSSSSSAKYHTSKEHRYENMTADINNNYDRNKGIEIQNENVREYRNEKQTGTQKSHNLILRSDLWSSYRKTTDELKEIVDQLLYKDLMCVHLTDEILNFSNANFTVEDEMLDEEEKFLEDQIFNSTCLLQTLETITEHQQVELKILTGENKRIDVEMKERQLKLQSMQRAFRNKKFKNAPKQLKRYCSVESLLSDVDHNENERRTQCDIVWDEQDEYKEEISLV